MKSLKQDLLWSMVQVETRGVDSDHRNNIVD